MAANKQIIIAGKRLLYGTSVKCSPEISSSSTQTFDGAITQGLNDVGWTIEIESIEQSSINQKLNHSPHP